MVQLPKSTSKDEENDQNYCYNNDNSNNTTDNRSSVSGSVNLRHGFYRQCQYEHKQKTMNFFYLFIFYILTIITFV